MRLQTATSCTRIRRIVSAGQRQKSKGGGEAHEKQYARTISSVSSVVSALVKSAPTLRWLSGISAPEHDAVFGDVPPARTADGGR